MRMPRPAKGWLLMAATITTTMAATAPFGPAPAQAQTQAQAQAGARARPAASDAVKVCQVGYLPGEPKRAMLTADATGDVVVRRAADGSAALIVKADAARRDADSGDEIRAVDFSALREPGAYYLDVPGVGASHPFAVGPDVFAKAYRLALRSFYGQRCGVAVDLAPDFPQYRYDACHHAPATFHASSGKTGEIDMTGGWHDAGDFGRYVVNSGISTGTLLWAHELNADKLRGVRVGIPESEGPLPDLLAEAKWNLDWMLKMQDPADGGVWHKATSERFCGFVMPKDDPLPVFVIGSGKAPFKTTASTADFAAVCAVAARAYRPFDAAYADRCLDAARRAWAWLEATPDATYEKQPEGVQTGGYGDANVGDERLWAAAELFRTTGEKPFDDYFLAHHAKWTLKGDGPQSWAGVENMALYSYALSGRPEASGEVVAKIRRDAVAAADAIVARVDASGYRMPLPADQYIWGSNGQVANYAMMLRLADRFEPKPAYAAAAQDALHYLLGRNHFNTSFLTHVGTKFAMRPHHRPSAADGIDAPWPGLLAGGPNSHNGRRDADKQAKSKPPATVWFDDQGDYVTNENAINWNAPLVFILAEALP